MLCVPRSHPRRWCSFLFFLLAVPSQQKFGKRKDGAKCQQLCVRHRTRRSGLDLLLLLLLAVLSQQKFGCLEQPESTVSSALGSWRL